MTLYFFYRYRLSSFEKNPFIPDRFVFATGGPEDGGGGEADDDATPSPRKPRDEKETDKPEEKEASPQEDKKKKKAEDTESGEKEIEKVQRDTRERIARTLTIVQHFRAMAPNEKAREPLIKLEKELKHINDIDARNLDRLKILLKGEYGKSRISIEDAHSIIGYNAEDRAHLKSHLRRLRSVPSFERAQIEAMKKEEWSIERQFDKRFKNVVTIVNRIAESVSDEMYKRTIIRTSERSLGVSLEEGNRIGYLDPATKQRKVMEIASVDIDKKLINAGTAGEDELFSPLRITTKDGQVFSLGNFDKFINYNEGHEIVDSKLALEDRLGWNMLGITLQPRMELEYDVGTPGEPEKRIPERVKVNFVSDTHVVLEKEVLVSKEPLKKKQSFTFAEFALWAKRYNVQKAIAHADEMREILATYNAKSNEKKGMAAEQNPPIGVRKGEMLMIGDDPEVLYTVKNVGNDSVDLSNGKKMTFPQFLRWILDNDVRKYDKEGLAKKVKEDLKKGGVSEEDANKAEEKKRKDLEGDEEKGKEAGDMTPPKDMDIAPPDIKESIWGKMSDAVWGEWEHNAMSVTDIYSLIVAIKDYIARRHDRKSKNRFSWLGKNLPTNIKYEMKRINQQAENEEVQQYQESMSQMGVWEVKNILYESRIKDQLKACFIVLAEKGHIRWDDKRCWKSINRQVSRNLQIPMEAPKGKTIQDAYLSPAIDSLWGEGQFNDWHSQNNRVYKEKKKAFTEKGDQYEGDPNNFGGLSVAMANMLEKWKKGEWVDAQEYEGLIDFALTKGKAVNEDRLYFLLEGVTAVNPNNGETLLSFDRIGNVAGEFLNQLPFLEVFTDKGTKKRKGDKKGGPWTPEAVREITEWWNDPDYYYKDPEDESRSDKPYRPNARVREFMWKYVLTHPRAHVRTGKGIRNAQNMDHDDAHVIIPLLSETTVKQTLKQAGGSNEYWTIEGRKNAYAGYSQYLKSLSEMDPEDRDKFGEPVDQIQRMKKALKGFIFFDTISDNIYDKGNNVYSRGGSADDMDKPCVVDAKHGLTFRNETRNYLKYICDAYGHPELYDTIYKTSLNPEDMENYDMNRRKATAAIDNFGEKFEAMIGNDEEKFLRISREAVSKGILEGMSNQPFSLKEMAVMTGRADAAAGTSIDEEAEINRRDDDSSHGMDLPFAA